MAKQETRAEAQDAAKTKIAEAQAATEAARATTTPDATYLRGVPGANVNTAVPKDAPVISTYEDALEAGYFGVAPGHANTAKLSVAAVTERDRAVGLAGTKGLKGAVVNGPTDDPNTAKPADNTGGAQGSN